MSQSVPADTLTYVTKVGADEEARLKAAGEPFIISHIAVGGGLLDDALDPRDQTELVNELHRYAAYTNKTVNEGEFLSQADIVTPDVGFRYYEIANYLSTGVLYSYTRAVGDYVPGKDEQATKGSRLRTYFKVQHADNVLINIEQSPLAVLEPDFDVYKVYAAATFERIDNAATNAEIDSQSNALKHIKLPQLFRALSNWLNNLKAENNPFPQYWHNDEVATNAEAIAGTTNGKILTALRGMEQFKSRISSSLTGTRSDYAASENALKTAYNKAVSAYNLANGKADAGHGHTPDSVNAFAVYTLDDLGLSDSSFSGLTLPEFIDVLGNALKGKPGEVKHISFDTTHRPNALLLMPVSYAIFSLEFYGSYAHCTARHRGSASTELWYTNRQVGFGGGGTWYRFYHSGNKPTPVDIGAIATSDAYKIQPKELGSGVNYDSITTTGWYAVNGHVNNPGMNAPYGDRCLLQVWTHGTWTYQKAVSYYNEANVFWRCFKDTESNVPWTRDFSQAYPPTPDDVGALSKWKLLKSGTCSVAAKNSATGTYVTTIDTGIAVTARQFDPKRFKVVLANSGNAMSASDPSSCWWSAWARVLPRTRWSGTSTVTFAVYCAGSGISSGTGVGQWSLYEAV